MSGTMTPEQIAVAVTGTGGPAGEYRAAFEAARMAQTPPETIESPEQIALRFIDEHDERESLVGVITEAVKAGIQSAWESWEQSDTTPGAPAERAELRELVKIAQDAAEGDSNNAEISALQEVMSAACAILGIEVEL